jgi:hypothetical protein
VPLTVDAITPLGDYSDGISTPTQRNKTCNEGISRCRKAHGKSTRIVFIVTYHEDSSLDCRRLNCEWISDLRRSTPDLDFYLFQLNNWAQQPADYRQILQSTTNVYGPLPDCPECVG